MPSKNAIQLIAEKRERQKTVHGYSPANDARYVKGELLKAAISYFSASFETLRHILPSLSWWPWDVHFFRPEKNPTECSTDDLVNSAALIAAEIDRRLLMAEAQGKASGGDNRPPTAPVPPSKPTAPPAPAATAKAIPGIRSI